jgi:hypothetical protein
MQAKIELNLNSRQLQALNSGKNIQIGKENIGGDMEFSVDIKTLNKIQKAVSKNKSTRINASSLNAVSGSGFNIRNMSKVIPKSVQNKLKKVAIDKTNQYVNQQIDKVYNDSKETIGGATYWQRVARRARNTGNQIQAGFDKVIPRDVQRRIKAKALDKLEQKTVGYIDGLGVKSKVKLPNSQLLYGDYAELPSSYFEPNNIHSIHLNRIKHGGSFRSP